MLGVRQNTLSNNLSSLVNVGLIRNQREGRSIRYFADFDGMSRLLGYLLHDCCGASGTVCEALVDDIVCAAAATPPNPEQML
jgi:DNA-binding transcriptional ArsR family regulator